MVYVVMDLVIQGEEKNVKDVQQIDISGAKLLRKLKEMGEIELNTTQYSAQYSDADI